MASGMYWSFAVMGGGMPVRITICSLAGCLRCVETRRVGEGKEPSEHRANMLGREWEVSPWVPAATSFLRPDTALHSALPTPKLKHRCLVSFGVCWDWLLLKSSPQGNTGALSVANHGDARVEKVTATYRLLPECISLPRHWKMYNTMQMAFTGT